MRLNSTLFSLMMLFVCISVNATDYNLSSSGFDITTPGSHTITGTGGGFYVTNTVANGVYNITLDNMNLTADTWCSAIILNNQSTKPMTVNFNIIGANSTIGYNHGGIKSIGGVANVVFTTASSGTLTCSAHEGDNYAFQVEGSGMNPSVDPNVTCTATLAGTSMSVADALAGAFANKPLVLTLTKTAAALNEKIKMNDLKVYLTNAGVSIDGLQKGESFEVFDISGRCVINAKAENANETVNLSKGVYLLRTTAGTIKFIK